MTMMRAAVAVVMLAAAIALGTAAFGWWAVPVISAAWGLIAREDARAARKAALAAALGWGGVLAGVAMLGPAGAVATRIGGVVGVGAAGLVALTIAFPALLAWSMAAVARGVRSS